VAAGDVVVQFDATNLQRTLEQKESELKQAEAEISRAESEQRRRVQAATSDLVQARSAVARAKLDLAQLEVRSQVEGEKLKIVVANAERHITEDQEKLEGERMATAADVDAGKQKRDKALYDVRETERIMMALTLRAPSGGAISIMPNYRAAGNSRSAPEFKRGDRAWFGAPIAELPDLSSVQMVCHVDEADRARVQNDLAARISVDAIPDRDLGGAVRDISIVAKPDFTSWPPVRNFDVAIALRENDPRIRSGMSATARVELERLANVLTVPPGAVFQRGPGSVVYIVNGRSVETRSVTVFRRGKDQVVLSSGVKEGERVALREPDSEAGTP
jgi:HlyD family secretion protein